MIAVPHLPATCAACFLLCTPHEKAIAISVRRLIVGPPLNDQEFFMPARAPLCGQQSPQPYPGGDALKWN